MITVPLHCNYAVNQAINTSTGLSIDGTSQAYQLLVPLAIGMFPGIKKGIQVLEQVMPGNPILMTIKVLVPGV